MESPFIQQKLEFWEKCVPKKQVYTPILPTFLVTMLLPAAWASCGGEEWVAFSIVRPVAWKDGVYNLSLQTPFNSYDQEFHIKP